MKDTVKLKWHSVFKMQCLSEQQKLLTTNYSWFIRLHNDVVLFARNITQFCRMPQYILLDDSS